MAVKKKRATRVVAVRASVVQWERWDAAAGAAGLTRNGWVRQRLDEAAELDEAEARDVRTEAGGTGGGAGGVAD